MPSQKRFLNLPEVIQEIPALAKMDKMLQDAEINPANLSNSAKDSRNWVLRSTGSLMYLKW